MKQRPRIYYSDSQKAQMWDRWKEGWTLHQIAQLFDRSHTSVQGVLARTGGIRPPERTRCETALTLAEREEISRAVGERAIVWEAHVSWAAPPPPRWRSIARQIAIHAEDHHAIHHRSKARR